MTKFQWGVGWASAHQSHQIRHSRQIRRSRQIRHSPPKTETAESRRFAKTLDAVGMVGADGLADLVG